MKKEYDQATKTAVKVGTGISFGLMAYGFITLFTGSIFGGLWFIIIGWFLPTAAQTSLQQHEISSHLASLQLKDIMISDFIYVNSNSTVGLVVQNYFNVNRKSEFPVLDQGYLVGSISNRQINTISLDKYYEIPVNEIMIPVNDLIFMDKNDRADETLRQMYLRNKNRVYVCIGYHKNKMVNGWIKNKMVNGYHKNKMVNGWIKNKMVNGWIKNKIVINKRNEELEPLSYTSSLFPDYNESNKAKLEGIVSKTDLLNIAKNDDNSKENPTN